MQAPRVSWLERRIEDSRPSLTDKAGHKIQMIIPVDSHVLQETIGVAVAEADRDDRARPGLVEFRYDSRLIEAERSELGTLQFAGRDVAGRFGISLASRPLTVAAWVAPVSTAVASAVTSILVFSAAGIRVTTKRGATPS